MKNDQLIAYLDIAKGKDRTMGEYASAAGINLSMISRIKNGTYTPGVKVLKKLTSEKAQPRGGISFPMLYEAVTLANVVPVVGTVLAGGLVAAAAATGIKQKRKPNSVETKAKTKTTVVPKELIAKEIDWEEYKKEHRRFVATAKGIIFDAILQKGIKFQTLNSQEQEGHRDNVEFALGLEQCQVEIWNFIFAPLYKSERDFDEHAKEAILKSIGQLVLTTAEEKQKVSIVVSDNKLYKYLLEYKEKLSYRGNLSVIYVNVDEVMICKEEYLAYYSDDRRSNLVEII